MCLCKLVQAFTMGDSGALFELLAVWECLGLLPCCLALCAKEVHSRSTKAVVGDLKPELILKHDENRVVAERLTTRPALFASQLVPGIREHALEVQHELSALGVEGPELGFSVLAQLHWFGYIVLDYITHRRLESFCVGNWAYECRVSHWKDVR